MTRGALQSSLTCPYGVFFLFFLYKHHWTSHPLPQEAEIEKLFFPVDSHLDTVLPASAAALTIVLIATHLIELPRFPTLNARELRIADRPGRNQPQWKASNTTRNGTRALGLCFLLCEDNIERALLLLRR